MSRDVTRTAVVELQALLFGYTVAFTGPTLTHIIEDVRLCGYDPADGVITMCSGAAFIASAAPLAAIPGAVFAGPACVILGRRAVLVGNLAFWIAGYGLLAVARSLPTLLVARALAGVATGVASVACNMYVAETSPSESRGWLGAGFNVGISVGILFAYAIGARYDTSTADGWWRVMALIGLVPAIAFAIGASWKTAAPAAAAGAKLADSPAGDGKLALLPESPAFLSANGKHAEARAAECALRGVAVPAKPDEAASGEGAPAADDVAPSGDEASLCSGKNRRAVLAGVGVTLCFTLTGNNMIVSFMDVLLAGAGANAFWGSLGYATAQVVAALVMAGGVAERFGRRDLMRLSAALSSACLIGLGLCARASASAAAGGAFIAIGMAFICAVTLGLSTLCWVYCAEVMPMAVRGKAMGLANLCFWVVTFCTVDSFPSLAVSIGEPNVFFLYAAFSALSCLFVHSCCVETRGCTLDEIEKRFAALDDPKRAVEEEGARRPLLDA